MGILSTYYLYLSKSNYNTTKRTINGRSHIQYTQVSYTKVSRIIRLTKSPKFTALLVFKQIKNNSLIPKWQNMQWLCTKVCNSQNINCMITNETKIPLSIAFHKTCSFSEKRTCWLATQLNKARQETDFMERYLTKFSWPLYHSHISV